MKGIGAVIVTCNSEAVIGACLDAVLDRVEQVVVVDNASTDRSREEVRKRPAVHLIANPENRGFAAAVNQGAAAVDLPLLLLLNPDLTLQADVGPLASVCADPAVGAAAGKLTGEDGRPQAGFSVRRFPSPAALAFEVLGLNRLWKTNPVNRRYRCLDLDLDSAAEVEQPAGAFLMIRRDAFLAVGGFDEGFRPVWFEDVDFLRRLRGAGYRIYYEPRVAAKHRGGHSVGRLPEESRVDSWYGSLLRYSARHYGFAGRLAVAAAVVVGCTGRMFLGALRGWKRQPLRAYGRVMWTACRRLCSSRIGEAGRSPVLARQKSG
ncbi:MAG: glycosyltransferase family 2 protein [Bryobacteraceae bacterium]